jgi:hypothetical protein
MGVVIRKTAAVEDIYRDVRTTLANSTARGGLWQELAAARLDAIMQLIDANTERLKEATAEYLPLKAAVEARDDEADSLLGKISDMIWNEVGRPASDPLLATLFPGGIRYYTEGNTEEQPHRMELLAILLESGTHPKVSADSVTQFAKELRDSALAFQSAIDALSAPAARVRQLAQVQRALATTAQAELAALKRRYKAENFSEADIHTVIPDRPPVAAKSPPNPVPPVT